MAETRGNIQYPVRGGSGRKIAYAIPKKGICDSAKRDMRFFIMASAFLAAELRLKQPEGCGESACGTVKAAELRLTFNL